MGGLALWVLANVRRRWRSTLVLGLLVGVSLGVSVGAAAGARRTATAFPRLVGGLAVPDLVVYTDQTATVSRHALSDQPNVETVGVGSGVGLMPRLADGSPDFDEALGALVTDGVTAVAIDRPLLLSGRLPDPSAPAEVTLDETAARQLALDVGDPFAALTFDVNVLIDTMSEIEASGREPTEADVAAIFTPVDLTVVGIARPATTILVNEAVTEDGSALLSPAFLDRHRSSESYTVAAVDLVDPGRAGAYVQDVRAALPEAEIGPSDQGQRVASVSAAVRPYWLAVALFAAVFAAGALLALGPAVLRSVGDDLADRDQLRALGASRRALVAGALVRPTLVAVAGGLVSVPVAWLLSDRFPVGLARRAEIAPGREMHVTGTLAAVLGLVLVVAGAAAVVAFASTRRASGTRARVSRVVAAAASLGLSPVATSALHAAFEPSAPTQRRRSALSGTVAAGAIALAALTFGTNLARLVDEPERFGWQWDHLFENYDTRLDDATASRLTGDPEIDAFAVISRGGVTLDDTPVPAIGMDPGPSPIDPTLLDGRQPARPGEVALARNTMRSLGVSVGDQVVGSALDGSELALAVVGTVVLPSLQLNESYQLGQGAVIGREDFDDLAGWVPTAALVRSVDGVEAAALEDRYGMTVLGVQRPGDVASYAEVRNIPFLLAAMLGALGLVVLVHLLVATTRHRRGDLGILRSLGFGRRQLRSTVLWQSSALAVAALAVAVPLGVVAGRVTWQLFADGIGVASDPAIPALTGSVGIVTALVAANLLSLPSARRAARLSASQILRSE